MEDYIIRGRAADHQVRFFAATSRNLVEEARKHHNTSPVVTAALGRLLTGGAMMGSMCKNETDVLTVQIKCSGPIGGLVVTADAKAKHQNEMVFPIGAPNDAFAKYFIGQSYLAPLSTQQVGIYNVTFEPGCRNNWHIHHAKSGGGQILVCVAGRGYYQEWGKPAQELRPGDVVNIPVGVKHWHGAAPDSWFSHLAVEVPGDETSNEWLEAVDNTVYDHV